MPTRFGKEGLVFSDVMLGVFVSIPGLMQGVNARDRKRASFSKRQSKGLISKGFVYPVRHASKDVPCLKSTAFFYSFFLKKKWTNTHFVYSLYDMVDSCTKCVAAPSFAIIETHVFGSDSRRQSKLFFEFSRRARTHLT